MGRMGVEKKAGSAGTTPHVACLRTAFNPALNLTFVKRRSWRSY